MKQLKDWNGKPGLAPKKKSRLTSGFYIHIAKILFLSNDFVRQFNNYITVQSYAGSIFTSTLNDS